MDGHALRFDDDTFDAAGSQFGVMLFPDMPRGIREMVRVVKPAGRVLMSVYGDPHRIDFLGFFVRAVQTVRPDFNGPPSDPPPLPFQLQDPRRLRTELECGGAVRRAGQDDHRVDELSQRPGAVGMDRVEQPDRRIDPRRTAVARRRARAH